MSNYLDTVANDDLSTLISTNYVLVEVAVGYPSFTKSDRAESQRIAASHGAADGTWRASKHLLAGCADEHKEAVRAYTALRTYLYANSLPWSSMDEGPKRGPRIMRTTEAMTTHIPKLNKLQKEATAARDAFLAVYDQRVQDALQRHGNAADPSEYPSRSDVERKFYASVDLSPLPASGDFSRMASVPAPVAKAMGERMAQRQKAAAEIAQQELLGRVTQHVTSMATVLSKHVAGENTKIYKSLVGNIRMVRDLLRSSNFADDPALNELAESLDELGQHDAAALRVSVTTSKELADKAKGVLKKLSGAAQAAPLSFPSPQEELAKHYQDRCAPVTDGDPEPDDGAPDIRGYALPDDESEQPSDDLELPDDKDLYY